MKTKTMAIVHPVAQLTGDDDTLRTQIWEQTTRLLTPMLGKYYARFEPAPSAWRQPVTTRLGVVLGRSDPALFLYFLAAGKERQQEVMERHLAGLLGGLDIAEKAENGSVRGFALNPKEDSEEVCSAHMAWYVGMTCGELFPDAGIYFAPAKQAVFSDKLTEDILTHLSDYAISLVRFYAEVEPK